MCFDGVHDQGEAPASGGFRNFGVGCTESEKDRADTGLKELQGSCCSVPELVFAVAVQRTTLAINGKRISYKRPCNLELAVPAVMNVGEKKPPYFPAQRGNLCQAEFDGSLVGVHILRGSDDRARILPTMFAQGWQNGIRVVSNGVAIPRCQEETHFQEYTHPLARRAYCKSRGVALESMEVVPTALPTHLAS